jgi:predicted RNase H-like HicB family nuclease
MADAGAEVEALIHPGDDGRFWAEVVGLPGCYAQGDNYSTIMANLRDAHELCISAPASASATPPPAAIQLGEVATVAELCAALSAEGWERTATASATHTLLGHAASGTILCVPIDPQQVLNSGFLQAVASYLGSP